MKQRFDENVVLETDRLIIRFIQEEDYKDLYHNILNDKDVLKYFLCQYYDDETKAKEYIKKLVKLQKENEVYMFSLVLKENNEVIGWMLQCSVPDYYHNSSEVGYAIGKKYWNKGYTSEALKAVIDYLFSLGIYKVFAMHINENVASGKVMEKCGMTFEGNKVKELYYNEQYYDCKEYYILNNNQ